MTKTNGRKPRAKKELATVSLQVDRTVAGRIGDLADKADTSEAAIYRAALRMALEVWDRAPNSFMEALSNHPLTCIT